MALLTSQVERDETFARRAERMEALVAELRERTALVARGGGDKAVERHRSRGKLTARERIDRLIDPGTAFLVLATKLGAVSEGATVCRPAGSVAFWAAAPQPIGKQHRGHETR